MINTYNLPMINLSAAAKATVNWPSASNGYTQISYDKSTGEILTSDHVGNSWTQYDDPEIITVCNTSRHMTKQAIADAIHNAMQMDQ